MLSNQHTLGRASGFRLTVRKPGLFSYLLCCWIWPNQALSLSLLICRDKMERKFFFKNEIVCHTLVLQYQYCLVRLEIWMRWWWKLSDEWKGFPIGKYYQALKSLAWKTSDIEVERMIKWLSFSCKMEERRGKYPISFSGIYCLPSSWAFVFSVLAVCWRKIIFNLIVIL